MGTPRFLQSTDLVGIEQRPEGGSALESKRHRAHVARNGFLVQLDETKR